MSDGVNTMTSAVISQLTGTSFGNVVRVQGVSTDQIRHQWSELSTEIVSAKRKPILVDGSRDEGGRGGLYEVLSRWVEEQCQDFDDRGSAMRLFDYLTMAMDMGSQSVRASERAELIVDAVVRLVEELVSDEPAVMVVVEPTLMSEVERKALISLMRHFLADPLADVDPCTTQAPDLGFVWTGRPEPPASLATQVVRIADRGEGEIRRFLNEDRVVERLLDTTEGDRRCLEALFDALPDTVTNLWVRRIEELTPFQRQVAQFLAISDVALDVSFLDRLVDGPVVPAVRMLYDAGIAVRQMDGGAVQTELANSEISEAIGQQISTETRRQLHLILARTAMETGREDGAFIARHGLAAGDEQLGLRFGLPAVRSLLRRGQWDAADALLTPLREITTAGESEQREILELSLRLAEARSSWREALSVAQRLGELECDSLSRGRLERRMAHHLVKIGHRDSAEKRFHKALKLLGDDGPEAEYARVCLGLAELAYHRGEHETARKRAHQAKKRLAGAPNNVAAEELFLDIRSLLGKVSLFRGELEDARKKFEKNAAEARRQGRRGRESRAEGNLGIIAIQQRRYEDAVRRLETALEKAEVPGGAPRLKVWLNLGIVYQRRGAFATAMEQYRRALREAIRCGDDTGYQLASHNLATLYQDMGAFDAARQLVSQLRNESGARREGENTDSSPGFTGRWASMVEAQILLRQGDPRRALQALKCAEEELSQAPRLYGAEMRLRQVVAHLELDEVDRARSILSTMDIEQTPSPQLVALSEYYEAAVARREGTGPDTGRWRALVDTLESLGLYGDAVEARLKWVSVLEEKDSGSETAEFVVEQGVEGLRRRADNIPERFRESFFSIPVHRALLRRYRQFSDDPLPVDWTEANDSSSSVAELESRSSTSSSAVDRDSVAYRKWRSRYGNIVGEEPQILQVFRFIDRVAPSETTMLLIGESGTGKELVAEAVHQHSRRSEQPFVKVNCAAFVEELLLSELFGHKKGAFTGAISDREGRFERADGGTIFLDEIGDISPKTQVALLRVLQEGTFEAVGGHNTRSVDVRVLAATNRDLDAMVREGTFRLDLYYRLKGFVIEMPPLRKRRQDIPRLLHHFAQRFCSESSTPTFADEVVQFLARYRWPGNVRELENFVRSVLLFAEGDEIGMEEVVQFREFFSRDDIDESLPRIEPEVEIATVLEDEEQWGTAVEPETALVDQLVADEGSLAGLKKRLEFKCIEKAMCKTGGNITQAARILKMKRPRLSQIVNGNPELLELKEKLVG